MYAPRARAQSPRALDRLHGLIPPGDAHRELRYRYMYCILGMDADPAQGVAFAEQGLADARRLDDPDAEANFHFCRGANQESLTTPRDALPDYNAGIAIARQAENTRLMADGLTWRGAVQSLLGEHALALVDESRPGKDLGLVQDADAPEQHCREHRLLASGERERIIEQGQLQRVAARIELADVQHDVTAPEQLEPQYAAALDAIRRDREDR